MCATVSSTTRRRIPSISSRSGSFPSAPAFPVLRADDLLPRGPEGRLRLIASPDGREGSVTINQSARVYAAILASGDTVEHVLDPGRHAWVQVAQGGVTVNGQALGPGDGAAIEGERALTLAAHEATEVLVCDLP